MNTKQLLLFSTLIFLLKCPYAKPIAPWVGVDLSDTACSGRGQGYGPFDYLQRKTMPDNLTIVEGAHFTPQVENLIKGNTSTIEDDLSYTLSAWPNHHPALLSMARYQLKINNKLAKFKKLAAPPECWFQRAINFSPKDAVTVSLYGYYLRKIGRFKEAANAYGRALEISPNTSKFEYAYSLLLIDLKQYDKALVQAKNAYLHGKPPLGLKNKLIKLGVWK